MIFQKSVKSRLIPNMRFKKSIAFIIEYLVYYCFSCFMRIFLILYLVLELKASDIYEYISGIFLKFSEQN